MLRKFSKILVVDDSLTMRKLVCGMLRDMGFENLQQAGDGGTALARLADKSHALVISDWNMAPMNGLELLNTLRQMRPFEVIPFVMMTSHAMKFSAIAREDGQIHYLVKPFTRAQLAEKIALAAARIAS